jgi:hypothetical protein
VERRLINEINYLNDRIGLAEMEAPTVLDIGAGYGRLGVHSGVGRGLRF